MELKIEAVTTSFINPLCPEPPSSIHSVLNSLEKKTIIYKRLIPQDLGIYTPENQARSPTDPTHLILSLIG